MSFVFDLEALLTVVAGIIDADGVLLDANPGFLRLLPAEVEQPIGANVRALFIQPSFEALTAATGIDGQGSYHGLMTMGDVMGKTRGLRGRVWRSSAGIHVLAEYDIDELERLNDVILDLNRESAMVQESLSRANVALKQRARQSDESSLTDALTGLGNRRRLEQGLLVEIERARRDGCTLSLIIADIDHFKCINDECGHGVGDQVLAHFGALFRSHTRPTDIVTRFGGEEFVLLMPKVTLDQAAAKAEDLRATLASAVIEPLTWPVTSSFGVAELLPGEDGASLLRRADIALYRAKETGRDRVSVAEPNPSAPPRGPGRGEG